MKKVFLALAATTVLYSCSKDRDEVVTENPDATVKTLTVKNLKVPSRGSAGYTPNTYILYSLKDNKEVESSKMNTADWDIGFNGTSIIVNGGSARQGKAAATVVDKAYAELKQAPTDDHFKGDEKTADGKTALGPSQRVVVMGGTLTTKVPI